MADLDPPQPDRLDADLRHLVDDIGVRVAGTPAERKAAQFIERRFAEAGADVWTERFAMSRRDVRAFSLRARVGERWETCDALAMTHTAETGGPINAPLVVFEAPAEYQRASLDHLAGAAVLHLGAPIESRHDYRRLIEARPAAVLLVDTRYPGVTPLGDSLFPAYCESIGSVPAVNLPYAEAWRWGEQGVDRIELNIAGSTRPAESTNVVAEFPGEDPETELILLGAHHDTQPGSVGADDNGTGVIGLIELARRLAGHLRRRGAVVRRRLPLHENTSGRAAPAGQADAQSRQLWIAHGLDASRS